MNVRSIDYLAPNAGDEFATSLRETGFAVLRSHPIPAPMLDRLRLDWSAFFSSDAKTDHRVDTGNGAENRAGYFPLDLSETAVDHDVKDLKEFYHVIADHPIPRSCEDSTRHYRQLGFELGANLLEWLQRCTPDHVKAALSEPLSKMICQDASVLRILHYPPLDGSESPGAVRAAAHEDINLLTILPAASQPGLQVRDNVGTWHSVSCDAGTLVVNSGDMLSEATAGFYPSTTHRVVNPGGGIENVSRISIPFFLTARLDVRLSTRYTAGEYLSERLNLISR